MSKFIALAALLLEARRLERRSALIYGPQRAGYF